MDLKSRQAWNQKPYYSLEAELIYPYICMLSPGLNYIEFEWLDENGAVELEYIAEAVEKSTGETVKVITHSSRVRINALKPDTDYEVRVSGGSKSSAARVVRTGNYRGKVINYLNPKDAQYDFSGRFLCSPSIATHKNKLFVSMDVYKSRAPQNLSLLFCSEDGGESFRYVTDLFPCYWGTLFNHNGFLYIIGTSTEYGDLLISRTADCGQTWETPAVICRGSGHADYCGIHKAPVPVLKAHSRVWIAAEWGSWNKKIFMSGIFSADENKDLLDAGSWNCTGFSSYGECDGAFSDCGGIEGNLVQYGNKIYNILRHKPGEAIMLETDPMKPADKQVFKKILSLPSAHSKFEIREYSGDYYMVGNRLPDIGAKYFIPQRNILSIYKSTNLENWEFIRDVVNCEKLPRDKVGFQYPSFIIDNGKAIVVSRTAINDANDFHDSNCITIHKFKI